MNPLLIFALILIALGRVGPVVARDPIGFLVVLLLVVFCGFVVFFGAEASESERRRIKEKDWRDGRR